MKKKIIAIGIISMFLLTGLTAASAVDTETSNVNACSGTGALHVTVHHNFLIIDDAIVTASVKDGSESYNVPYVDHCYMLDEIPVGCYEVSVWHCTLKAAPQDVAINEGRLSELTFALHRKSKSAQPVFLRLLDLFPILRLLIGLQ